MFRGPRRASWHCTRGAFAAIALSISARHGEDLGPRRRRGGLADRCACEAHADCASGVCAYGRTATEHRKSTGESFHHPGKI